MRQRASPATNTAPGTNSTDRTTQNRPTAPGSPGVVRKLKRPSAPLFALRLVRKCDTRGGDRDSGGPQLWAAAATTQDWTAYVQTGYQENRMSRTTTTESRPDRLAAARPSAKMRRAVVSPFRSATATAFLFAVLGTLAGAAFCGTRGLFDPSEGRYCEVAREMLERCEWLTPLLDYQPHWSKPPLAYWVIAAGLQLWGITPTGARLPYAVALGLTCGAVAWSVYRAVGPATAVRAAWVFVSLPLVHIGYSVLTTDALVCLMQALILAAYVGYRTGRSPDWCRLAAYLMWFFAGLAFLTKGPVALLVLLPIAWWQRKREPAHAVPLVSLGGLVLAAVTGLWWYAWAVWTHAELLRYWIGEELLARFLTNRFYRNGGWLGPLQAYGPPLLLGLLPWSAGWLRRQVRAWRLGQRSGERRLAFRAMRLWILAALLLFTCSRSRLPLYVLPLTIPAAWLLGANLRAHRRRLGYVASVSIALIGLATFAKIAAPAVPAKRDMTRLYRKLVAAFGPAGVGYDSILTYRETSMFGLQFYVGRRLHRIPPTVDDRDRKVLENHLTRARRMGQCVVIIAPKDAKARLEQALARVGVKPDVVDDRWWLIVRVPMHQGAQHARNVASVTRPHCRRPN